MSDSPSVQWTNTENVDQLRPWFVDRNEPNYAWKSACASVMALPALRAFWPLSSVDYTTASRARDVSGGAYHLSDNNTVTFGYDQLAPYANFVAASTQWLSRADGGAANWADIAGTESYVISTQRGLTLGGWFYFTSFVGTNEAMISKYTTTGNQRSYLLVWNAAAAAYRFQISNNGIAAVLVNSTVTPATGQWIFFAGRFDPSAEIAIFTNDTKDVNVAGIPASVYDGTAPLNVGAFNNGTAGLLDGRASMCFLCAAALSDSIITALYHQTRKLYGV